MEYENKLVPVLREGVDVVKMIFFKKLRIYLSTRYGNRGPTYASKLAGSMINELFGTPNLEEPFAQFCQENRERIKEELQNIATEFPEMRIPLTDALRVQFLCDYQEGIDSTFILTQARELQILLVDRDVPLPAQFISLVRKLGCMFQVLTQCPPAS